LVNFGWKHGRPQRKGPIERLLLDPRTPWWGEHRCRYRLALPSARGSRVLDIACGTGFGTAMLAAAGATCVAGVDVDFVSLAAARVGCQDSRAGFLAADGTQLPFTDASFDLAISFETLEHIEKSETYISEIRRVLTPAGTLILSTPNRDYTELNGQVCRNPFHVREYTRTELRKLLCSHFSTVELLGQRLRSEYRLSPFVSDHERMNRDGLTRVRLLWWKVQNKLPFPLKDSLSRLIAGHPFYPGEDSYEFTADRIETAPVLLALCHP
jgi:ubiquinone/menaquinone biosynthesis C-methylase UbiE